MPEYEIKIEKLFKQHITNAGAISLTDLAIDASYCFSNFINTKSIKRVNTIAEFINYLSTSKTNISNIEKIVYRDLYNAIYTDAKPNFNMYISYLNLHDQPTNAVLNFSTTNKANTASLAREIQTLFIKYGSRDIIIILKSLLIASQTVKKDDKR